MPLLAAGLPDVGRAGAEGEQAFQLGVLVPVHGVDVDVQRELSGLRVAARAQDDGRLQAAEPGVRRADLDGTVLPAELDIAEDLAPEPASSSGSVQLRTSSLIRETMNASVLRAYSAMSSAQRSGLSDWKVRIMSTER